MPAILTFAVRGAAIGAVFAFVQKSVIEGFSSDPFYELGYLGVGALLGALVGAIAGLFVRVAKLRGGRVSNFRSSMQQAQPPMWYLPGENNDSRGPFTTSEVTEQLQHGSLSTSDYAWREGFEEWVQISALSEFRTPQPLQAPRGRLTKNTSKPNYIIRHWRGELSLPVSYWVNNILVSIVVGVFAGAITIIDWTQNAKFAAGMGLSVWPLAIFASIWLFVGIWRSATHYQVSGKRWWGGIAKFAVIAGCVSTVSAIVQGAPLITDYASILTSATNQRTYTLRLLRNSTELEISGPLDFGVAREVDALLSDHPAIRTLHLNSEGGRLVEADRIKNAVLSRKLNTYVETRSLSACVTICVSGTNRWLAKGAVIGLHSAHYPGMSREDSNSVNRETRAFLLSRGVKQDIVDRGLNTPSDSMWTPDHQTLFASHLATSYATETDVAISGIKLSELTEMEASFSKLANIAAVRETDPATYQGIVTILKEGILRGETISSVRDTIRPILFRSYQMALPTSSDDALL